MEWKAFFIILKYRRARQSYFKHFCYGAPQKHGQRSYKSDIATYDAAIARQLGDDSDFSTRIVNKGIQYKSIGVF